MLVVDVARDERNGVAMRLRLAMAMIAVACLVGCQNQSLSHYPIPALIDPVTENPVVTR